MGGTMRLAIDGGDPVRSDPFPNRALIGEEEKRAVLKIFDEVISKGTAIPYNGPGEAQYERNFASFMGGGFADGVNSGTNAVFVALGALELDALSEIIVPAINDPGGVMPVLFAGCVPVVADSDPRTYNISADQIEPMITERTRAIIVAHIGGEPADMGPIMELARSRKLHVIEDCAQCFGGMVGDSLAGTIGDISVFSTMFGKHYSTGGQGGVVFTRDEALYWRAKRFADRGKAFHLPDRAGIGATTVNTDLWALSGNVVAGLNCNLNDLSAVIGSVQIKKLPQIIESRFRIGEAVKEALKKHGAVSMGWQVPDTRSVYWFMRLKLDQDAIKVDKPTFCRALAAEGLPVEPHYRKIPCEMPWFRNKAVFGKSGFPWDCSDYHGPRVPQCKIENAIKVTDEHFTILMHENYGTREIEDIVEAIEKVQKTYRR